MTMKRSFQKLPTYQRALILLLIYFLIIGLIAGIWSSGIIEKLIQQTTCRTKAAISGDDDVCQMVIKVKLAVPVLNQNSIWPNPERAKIACGVTSVYMALKYYQSHFVVRIDPDLLDRTVSNPNSAYNKYLKNQALTDDYLRAAFPDQFHMVSGIITKEEIQRIIDTGNPIVLYSGLSSSKHHIILITGYITNPRGSLETIIFNNPLSTDGQMSKMLWSDFSKYLDYIYEGRTINKYIYASY